MYNNVTGTLFFCASEIVNEENGLAVIFFSIKRTAKSYATQFQRTLMNEEILFGKLFFQSMVVLPINVAATPYYKFQSASFFI